MVHVQGYICLLVALTVVGLTVTFPIQHMRKRKSSLGLPVFDRIQTKVTRNSRKPAETTKRFYKLYFGGGGPPVHRPVSDQAKTSSIGLPKLQLRVNTKLRPFRRIEKQNVARYGNGVISRSNLRYNKAPTRNPAQSVSAMWRSREIKDTTKTWTNPEKLRGRRYSSPHDSYRPQQRALQQFYRRGNDGEYREPNMYGVIIGGPLNIASPFISKPVIITRVYKTRNSASLGRDFDFNRDITEPRAVIPGANLP